MALAHFYGGALTYDRLKTLPMYEINEAAKFMRQEQQREAKRNGA